VSEAFTYGVYNNAVKVLGDTYPISFLVWIIAPDDRVCPRCRENSAKGEGGRFKPGWFLPQMPVHPRCRCQWELHVVQELKPGD
jgi:hypothetical protein